MKNQTKIIEFCDKWINLFADETTTAYQLMDDNSFPEACFSFGWEMDCGNAFFEKYSCPNFDRAIAFVPREEDPTLLGSLLFSYWRYFNHWAYSSAEILEHRDWFIIVLQQIKGLTSQAN